MANKSILFLLNKLKKIVRDTEIESEVLQIIKSIKKMLGV